VGEKKAVVVVFFHGAYMTGRFCRHFEDIGKEENIWFLCPTLAGWGVSTPTSRRPLQSTSFDVEMILRKLEIPTPITLIGYGMGSPHAIAAASLLSYNVRSIGLFASVWPIVPNQHDPFAGDPANYLIKILLQSYIRDIYAFAMVQLGYPSSSGLEDKYKDFIERYPDIAEIYLKEDAMRSVHWYHEGLVAYFRMLNEEGNSITEQLRKFNPSIFPVRLWHYTEDNVSNITNSRYILSQLSCDDKELITLNNGDHLTLLGEMDTLILDTISLSSESKTASSNRHREK